MGNNAIYKVIGIGNIIVTLHDMTVREIKQVRHVLDLKRILISLEMLDQIGCSIKVEYGELRIVKA